MFNGPFVDILIFAVLAIFLVFRLRSILGRRDGFEEDPNTKAAKAFKTQSKPDLETDLPSGEGIDAVVGLIHNTGCIFASLAPFSQSSPIPKPFIW